LDFIEKVKNGMLYNASAAIIHKVNLTPKLGSIRVQVKWLWYNYYVKTQPTPSDHLFYLLIWLL